MRRKGKKKAFKILKYVNFHSAGLSFHTGKVKMPLAKILGVGCPGLYALVHVWKEERKLTNVEMGGFWTISKKGREGQGGANSLRSVREWVQKCAQLTAEMGRRHLRVTWHMSSTASLTAGRCLPQFSTKSGRWDTACFSFHSTFLSSLLHPPLASSVWYLPRVCLLLLM